MKPEEMLAKAYESQKNKLMSCGYLALVLPWRPRGENVRLCKHHGPTGRVAQWRENDCIAFFPADKIIQFLEANGVEYKPCSDQLSEPASDEIQPAEQLPADPEG